jgi:hypothetical protein
VYYSGAALVNPTLFIAANITVNFEVSRLPMTVGGRATFTCQEAVCHFNVGSRMKCSDEQPSAISFVPYPKTATYIEVLATGVAFGVPSLCECGLTISSSNSVNRERSTTINSIVHSVSNGAGGVRPFYSVAVGNVGGTLDVADLNASVIVLSSQYAAVNVVNGKSEHVIDVGKLMSVFGTFYEIEFYNNGREFKDKSVIPTVNRYLALILVFCRSLAVANGHH